MSKSPWIATAAAAGAAVAATAIYMVVKKYKESKVTITLSPWLVAYEKSLQDKIFTTDEEMMAVAIEISARNVSEATGGPFGCAIFERDSNGKCKLFSVGANRVVPLSNSTLHGEMVAIQFAEQKLKSFSLRQASSEKEYIMCTSCEPCAMCLGGTLWAGPTEMLCAAAKDDAEAIGFNEGPVFPESYSYLEKAGIKVKRSIMREQGAKVLKEYGETGAIYNS